MEKRNRKKWISLRLVDHTRVMEKLKERREKVRQDRGKNGSSAPDQRDEKIQLLRSLCQAWQEDLEVEIHHCQDGRLHCCKGRIELLRREDPSVIMKSGERLNLEDIKAVGPAGG